MPAPYSTDFRLKVVNSYLEKDSLRKTAEKFDVSYKFVRTSVRRYKIKNTVEPEPHKSGNPPEIRSIHHIGFLKKLIVSENDLSLNDICDRFKNKFSGNVSVTGMHESLKRIGISGKKSSDIQKWTGCFLELIFPDPKSCIFIDETGAFFSNPSESRKQCDSGQRFSS